MTQKCDYIYRLIWYQLHNEISCAPDDIMDYVMRESHNILFDVPSVVRL